ncbi:MAG: glycosyltransferase family 4 protein [Candidatus Sigynarchaeota archaeon]
MNICVFTRVIGKHSIGGMQNHTTLFTEALAQAGHFIHIITAGYRNLSFERTQKGIFIHYLRGVLWKRYSFKWWLQSRKKFIELHKKYNFDVIFSESTAGYSYFLFGLKRKYPMPFIQFAHGTAFGEINSVFHQKFSFRSIASIIYLLQTHYILGLPCWYYSDLIIAISRELKLRILKESRILDQKRVIFLPNGVDGTKFFPQKAPRKGSSTILCIGRIIEQKGFQVVISAVASLKHKFPAIKLAIIGEGEYLPSLKQLVSRLKLDDIVSFIGVVPEEKLNEYYNSADILIVPSLRIEGLPFTILEGMACQLPIIASRIGGIPTAIIDNVNGILIPPNNVSIMEQKIELLLENKEFAGILALNARNDFIKRFDNTRITDIILSIIKRLKDLYNKPKKYHLMELKKFVLRDFYVPPKLPVFCSTCPSKG